MIVLWLALACGTPAPQPGVSLAPDTGLVALPTSSDPDLVLLDPARLARRVSLDLRGVLPDVDELDVVAARTVSVETLSEAWLDDPRLEERLVRLLAERWHTRVEEFLVRYDEYPQLAGDPTWAYPFQRAVGEEPLRLMAHIVVEDRPWDDVVTTDHTMANGLLAELWPLDHPGGEDWAPSTYTDGRPAAGVLATNGLWWRYYTTLSNYNRGRVAAISRLLVCEDYAGRLVSLTESEALGEGDVEDALRESPTCMGCHSSLDPVAAALFGFWPANEYSIEELQTYHPDRESLGADLLGVEPAWYGDPIYGLNELGAHIARDPRFAPCAVESFSSLLWRRAPTLADRPVLDELESTFEGGERRVKPLLAAILQTDVYRAGAVSADASDERLQTEATLRLQSPDQLASSVAALTGFVWTWEGFDQLDNDVLGFRVLAGGVDGKSITRAQESPGMTWWLVVQRLAEAAAEHAVAQGGALVSGLDLAAPPSEADLERLFWWLTATELPAEHAVALMALWESVAADDGAERAWITVLSVLLRDPLFVTT